MTDPNGRPPKTWLALVDTLIPSDSQSPGGREAGTADAVWQELSKMAMARQLVIKGLRALNQASQTQANRPFQALDADARRALLSSLQAGQRPAGWDDNAPLPEVFFTTVRNLVVSHYFSQVQGRALAGMPTWPDRPYYRAGAGPGDHPTPQEG
ncbi:MAG: gluconate 2-dehydrogenase subunit 3 family protein [Firmicutes bacterium]|nr:gluconate 2-dehydrogenase subunit 3 family protein [Bacillota bacterium]